MTDLKNGMADAINGFGKLAMKVNRIPGVVEYVLDECGNIISESYAGVNSSRKGAMIQQFTSTEPDGESTVFAEGDRLGFMEFGTGAWVEANGGGGNELLRDIPFAVESGSWSREHKGTWEEWIASGKDPEKYPFNCNPTHGFQRGLDYVNNDLDMAIRRVMNV